MNHSISDRIALKIADYTASRPWRTILISMVLVAVTATGVTGLGLASNYRVFFSPQNPELVAFENFQATYTKNDNIFFFVAPKNSGDAVFSRQVISAVERLTERAWQIPYTIRVDSVTNFQHSWAQGDDLTVEDLVRDGVSLSREELDRKRLIAAAEPLLHRNLLAADGSATGVNVVLQYPEKSEAEVPEAVAVARQLEQEIEAAYPVEISLTGVSMLNHAFAEAGQTDAMTLIPAMYGILLLATLLVLRSFAGTVATLLIIVTSTLTAVGLAGHYGAYLSPISITAPTVIMTLAVADSIHILVSMLALMRKGRSKKEALRESLRTNFLPISITSVTTIIGFLALNFSDSPPFNHLGNITAIGIGAAWLYSILLLPAVLQVLPVKTRGRFGNQARVDAVFDAISQFVITRVKPKLEFNDQWVDYFDQRVTFRTDTDTALATMPGIYPMEFSIKAKGPGGISDPEYLHNLARFAEWLRLQPEVEHVFSYTDIIKRLNKNMHGDDTDYYGIPEHRDLAAQYLLLYEMSLPFGLDLNDRINVDKSATRVTATLRNVSTAETRAFLVKSQDWLLANTPQHMWTKATSANVMFSFISQRNIESMLAGNGVAVVLIALVLMVALRSFRLGTLSLIPNLLPILMTYGLWTLLVGRLGMAAATVSATSLGIIVDDTVHFLAKYQRARRGDSYDQPRAIRYAFHNVGPALTANSLILAAGFAFLALSTFKVNLEMGLLTALAIGVALAFDFLVLPALLMLGHRKDLSKSQPRRNTDEIPAYQKAA
jgi:predicted RND superfamily exporter protein